MAGWTVFALAWAAFLGAHVIPMLPPVRARLVGALGRRNYFIAFGTMSVLLLWLLIVATNAAPLVMLADQMPWQRWLVNLAMPCAILLTVYGLQAPNPFGLGRKGEGFDPDRPGIIGLTRHPLMWAFALWAGAHLVANPDLAHAIFFGVLLAYALRGMAKAESRARADGTLAVLGAHTGFWPFAALIAGRWRPQSPPALRPLLWSALIWVAALALHPYVIGASPLP